MPPELTAAQEAAFFATGELPPDILAAQTAVLGLSVAPPAPAPADAPAPVVPTVADSAAHPAPAAPAADMSATLADLRRTLESKLAELETKLAPKPAPVVAPDPTTDPLGNMIHQLTAVNERIATLDTRLTETQQQNLLRQQYEQFATSVRTLKEQFKATTPDFDSAYAHIRAVRTEDLRNLGIPEADIPQVLHRDELQLAQAAIGRGKNPAEEMYAMAKRYGFAAKAAPLDPPAAPAAPMSAADKLDAIKRGVDASKSPPAAGGAAVTPLTLEGLKDAGNDDLNALVQNDKEWARILGGSSGGVF